MSGTSWSYCLSFLVIGAAFCVWKSLIKANTTPGKVIWLIPWRGKIQNCDDLIELIEGCCYPASEQFWIMLEFRCLLGKCLYSSVSLKSTWFTISFLENWSNLVILSSKSHKFYPDLITPVPVPSMGFIQRDLPTLMIFWLWLCHEFAMRFNNLNEIFLEIFYVILPIYLQNFQ